MDEKSFQENQRRNNNESRKSKKQKIRRTTSVFYYDHGGGGGGGDPKKPHSGSSTGANHQYELFHSSGGGGGGGGGGGSGYCSDPEFERLLDDLASESLISTIKTGQIDNVVGQITTKPDNSQPQPQPQPASETSSAVGACVQQIKSQFEKIYKTDRKFVKRTPSSFRRSGKPLSQHFSKIFQWRSSSAATATEEKLPKENDPPPPLPVTEPPPPQSAVVVGDDNSLEFVNGLLSLDDDDNHHQQQAASDNFTDDLISATLASAVTYHQLPQSVPNNNNNIDYYYTEKSSLINDDDDSFGEEDQPETDREQNAKDILKIGVKKIQSSLYKSLNRPKTEVFEAKNRNVILKSHSYHPELSTTTTTITPETPEIETPEIETPEMKLQNELNLAAISNLRKQFSFTLNIKDSPPIIEEILRTEEKYIENISKNLEIYGRIFENNTNNIKNLPKGLIGKKYVLFGNIEEIYEFHLTILLPMLQRNRNNLKQMFDEFATLIEDDQFYGYILFTINKKKSLKLCAEHSDYFKELQQNTEDKLGIHSFLVLPILRLVRYPLLLTEFYKTYFGDINYKEAIASCCKLDKKLRKLLITVNECEEINDIEDCFDLNVFYQGHFKKVNEFTIYDYTAKRNYRAKVFIFDKCLIYTEIKEKRLIYRGCYPCEMIGFLAKPKSFTLYYEKRKRQECDFEADAQIIELWIELIRDMITIYAIEEKRKLQQKYSNRMHINNSEIYRRPTSEMILRNTSRISADSGISGMTVEEISSPKTTWYETL